jgi:hypothetical protein
MDRHKRNNNRHSIVEYNPTKYEYATGVITSRYCPAMKPQFNKFIQLLSLARHQATRGDSGAIPSTPAALENSSSRAFYVFSLKEKLDV